MNMQAEQGRGAGLPAHETVYRRVRGMILFGEMQPGQSVTIQGLTETLGAGMTPVREALRRLTAEGALDRQGNRRIAVPLLDTPAVQELTTARVALEPVLAARAVPHIANGAIRDLAQIDARLDQAIVAGDIGRYLRENHAFHARLNAEARAPVITALVEGLWLRFGPSLRVVCGQVGTRNLPDRHKDLLTALADRDSDATAAAMRADVEQGMGMIAEAIDVQGQVPRREKRFD